MRTSQQPFIRHYAPGTYWHVIRWQKSLLPVACIVNRNSYMPTRCGSSRGRRSSNRSLSRTSHPICYCPPITLVILGSYRLLCFSNAARRRNRCWSDGEHDLVLRCTSWRTRCTILPKLLANRGRVSLDSDAATRLALKRAAIRGGFEAEVLDGCLAGTYRLKREVASAGQGLHHHSNLCGARSHRDMHRDLAGQDSLSKLRDRLYRKHTGRPASVESLAEGKRRQGYRDNEHSIGLASTTVPWRLPKASTCCS